MGVIWRAHLAGPLAPATQDPTLPFVVLGDGTTLRSQTACGGEQAGSVTLAAPLAGAPVVVDGAAFVTTTSGVVVRVGVDPSSGALSQSWTKPVVRDSCPQADKVSAPAVQPRSTADAAFQSTFPGDVIFVGTAYGCGSGAANQVLALSAATGEVLWTFNQAGTAALGAVRAAPVLDPTNHRLLVGTMGPGPTLYAIDMRNGAALWSADSGPLGVPPLVVDDRVFTADQQGNVRAWPADGGAHPLWTKPMSNQPITLALVDFGTIDVTRSVILVAAGGTVTPVTYDGEVQPPLTLPAGQVSTAPVAYPSERVFYVGGTDGGVWQLDVAGTAATRRALADGTATVCCGTLTLNADGASIVFGSSSGDVARFAIPWSATP
jgi:outer membrane protein assembly factor BamB